MDPIWRPWLCKEKGKKKRQIHSLKKTGELCRHSVYHISNSVHPCILRKLKCHKLLSSSPYVIFTMWKKIVPDIRKSGNKEVAVISSQLVNSNLVFPSTAYPPNAVRRKVALMLLSLLPSKTIMVLRWEAYRFHKESVKYLIPGRAFFSVNTLHRYCIAALFRN